MVMKRHYHRGELILFAGDELCPDSLDQTTIDQLLDQGVLFEVQGRLSYFALLKDFAGAKNATTSKPVLNGLHHDYRLAPYST